MNEYELQRIKRESYTKGLRDGQAISSKADISIRLVNVLTKTKGVGKTILERAIRINKEME